MNKTQRIHAIKRVLKEDVPALEFEFTRKYAGFEFYRLRNARREDFNRMLGACQHLQETMLAALQMTDPIKEE